MQITTLHKFVRAMQDLPRTIISPTRGKHFRVHGHPVLVVQRPELGRSVAFVKTRLGLRFEVNDSPSSFPTYLIKWRLDALSELLNKCKTHTKGLIDISDGEDCGEGIVSLCANNPASILIPDPEFIDNRGYAVFHKHAKTAPSFMNRSDTVLWRGVTTGTGIISADGMSGFTPELLQRTRMCLLLKDVENCDAKFSKIVQSQNPEMDAERLRQAGILGEYVPATNWSIYRYHICVDGNTLAWSSTFSRMAMGCCLIKPGSPGNYKQWYSAMLKPWEHFVPVDTDLSNLIERIEWCRSNTDECAQIAARGKVVANQLELKSEMAKAARLIDDAFQAGRLRDPWHEVA